VRRGVGSSVGLGVGDSVGVGVGVGVGWGVGARVGVLVRCGDADGAPAFLARDVPVAPVVGGREVARGAGDAVAVAPPGPAAGAGAGLSGGISASGDGAMPATASAAATGTGVVTANGECPPVLPIASSAAAKVAVEAIARGRQ
jgi:hypothetical protein